MQIPIFPLGSVVFPTLALPLQIFEDRYKQMMKDLMAGDGKFGSVWIERGYEVGGGDDRTDVGTLLHVQKATELADGRWMILGVGLQRIRITNWLPDDPYPMAEVEEWPESFEDTVGRSDPGLAQMRELAISKWHEVAIVSSTDPSELPELHSEPDICSLQLSALLPLASIDAYRLLSAPGPVKRYELIMQFLDGILAFQGLGST